MEVRLADISPVRDLFIYNHWDLVLGGRTQTSLVRDSVPPGQGGDSELQSRGGFLESLTSESLQILLEINKITLKYYFESYLS